MRGRVSLLLLLTCAWAVACEDVVLRQLRALSKGRVACALIDGKGKDESRRAAAAVDDAREMVGAGRVEVVRVTGQGADALARDETSLRSSRATHPHMLVFVDGRREALVPLPPDAADSTALVAYFRTHLYNSVTHETLATSAAVQAFLADPRALRLVRFAAEKREGGLAAADDCGFTAAPSLADVSWWDQLCGHFLSNGSVRLAAADLSLSPLSTEASGDVLVAKSGFDGEVFRYDGCAVCL